MVMKVINKKLIRDMRKTKGQVIAVCAVIICGIAGFSSVLSTFRNLKLTRDTYYKEYRFADFTIMMEKAPLSSVFKVKSIPGVKEAQGRIVKDVNLDIPGADEPKIGRIISMPQRHPIGQINAIYLKSGRYFSEEVMDEVIMNDLFLKKNSLHIGDRIRASINNKKQSLRIIGTALSPEFVYMIRNSQEFIPSPDRFAVLWVKEKFAEMAFDMSEACNEIVGLAESEDMLDDIADQAEKRLEPYGYFTTVKKKDQLSNSYLSNEIDGLAVTARIWPALFLGIAAIILMIMLSRMVKRERTQIGLLKAYGYSNLVLGLHYIKFALLISTTGGILGFLLGQWMSQGMIHLYVQFFQFPLLRYRFYFDILFISLAIASLFALSGALAAVVRILKTSPAEAMRPESPSVYKTILLERIRILWQRLSFTWKVILRNIFRYKFRSSVTVLGVVLSTALLLMGYFSSDSMNYLIDHNFNEVQREDMRVSFENERPKSALREIRHLDDVLSAEALFAYPFTLRSGWRKKDLLITGLSDRAEMLQLMDIKNNRINVGEEGLILYDQAAKELGVAIGDRVILKPLLGKIKKEKTVKVSNIVVQYLGMGAYMNINAL
ncbi:MAG: FtsX-like permease family protein, partial [Promethearchaeota archaeon]